MKKFAKILLSIVALLVLAGYAVFQLPAFGGRFEGARLERMQRSPEFIDGQFQNTPPQKTGDSFWETIRLYRQGQIREPRFEIPVIALSPSTLGAPPAAGLRAIWFGPAAQPSRDPRIAVARDAAEVAAALRHWGRAA